MDTFIIVSGLCLCLTAIIVIVIMMKKKQNSVASLNKSTSTVSGSGPGFWTFNAGNQTSFNDMSTYNWNSTPTQYVGTENEVTVNGDTITFNNSGYYHIDWMFNLQGYNSMELCIAQSQSDPFNSGTLLSLKQMYPGVYEGTLSSGFYATQGMIVKCYMYNAGSNNAASNNGPGFWSFAADTQSSFNNQTTYKWLSTPVSSNGNTSAVSVYGDLIRFNQAGFYKIDWIYSFLGTSSMEMCISSDPNNPFNSGNLFGLGMVNSGIYEGSIGSGFNALVGSGLVCYLYNSGSNSAVSNNSK